MRRVLLLALAFVVGAQAQTLKSLVTTTAGTVALPSTTFGTLRTEFRIENFSTNGATRYVWILGAFGLTFCRNAASSQILDCVFADDSAPSGSVSGDMTGRTDARVRWQRDPVANIVRFDIWDGDCTNHVSMAKTIVPSPSSQTWSGDFGVGGGMTLSFLRLYSTLDTSGACPTDAPTVAADMLDFRFEGDSLTDSSTHAYSMTISSHSFADSTSYGPQPSITGLSGYKPVVRAGTPFQLDGSATMFFAGDPSGHVYRWLQVSGPAVADIVTKLGQTTYITAPVAGEYVFRLNVRDSLGTTAGLNQTVGVVATDSHDVVLTPSTELTTAIGPVTKHGTAPWTWYDVTEAADADRLDTPFRTAPTETPGVGLVSVLSGNNDSGTDSTGRAILVAPSLAGGIVVTGDSNTAFDSSLNSKYLIFHWDADDDATNKGRAIVYVDHVVSAHSLVVAMYQWTQPVSLSANMTWGIAGADIGGYLTTGAVNPWDYYLAGIGIYRVHRRTGLSTYLSQARSFCELWWRYALNSGYMAPVPRASGWSTAIACAADAFPAWWDAIAYSIDERVNSWAPTSPITPPTQWAWDPRENSYQLRAMALFAKLYPPHASDPTAARTKWCGYVANQVTNFWIAAQDTLGYWQENPVYWNVYTPMAPMSGRWGTAPWRGVGLGILAMEQAYDALADPAACNNPTLAASTLMAIGKAGDFLWNYARTSDGGIYANVLYESNGYMQGLLDNGIINPDQMPAGSTVSVTNGSATVVGTSTTFLTTFAPCDGTTYIGIATVSNPYVDNSVYRVVSCQNDTHLTLAAVYPHATETAGAYSKSRTATTTCTPSIASYCEPDWYDNRNLAADSAAGAAWLYARTGVSSWKTRAEYYAGKTFGGAAGGAGSLGDPVGPNADGRTGNFGEILPDCTSNSAPCGGGDASLAGSRGKTFGMAAGAGNMPNMLAYDAVAVPTDNRTVLVGFNLTGVSGATKAMCSVTQPNGTVATTTTSTSPCSLTVDVRQGNHMVKIDYLSSSDAVLAPGTWSRLTVQ